MEKLEDQGHYVDWKKVCLLRGKAENSGLPYKISQYIFSIYFKIGCYWNFENKAKIFSIFNNFWRKDTILNIFVNCVCTFKRMDKREKINN